MSEFCYFDEIKSHFTNIIQIRPIKLENSNAFLIFQSDRLILVNFDKNALEFNILVDKRVFTRMNLIATLNQIFYISLSNKIFKIGIKNSSFYIIKEWTNPNIDSIVKFNILDANEKWILTLLDSTVLILNNEFELIKKIELDSIVWKMILLLDDYFITVTLDKNITLYQYGNKIDQINLELPLHLIKCKSFYYIIYITNSSIYVINYKNGTLKSMKTNIIVHNQELEYSTITEITYAYHSIQSECFYLCTDRGFIVLLQFTPFKSSNITCKWILLQASISHVSLLETVDNIDYLCVVYQDGSIYFIALRENCIINNKIYLDSQMPTIDFCCTDLIFSCSKHIGPNGRYDGGSIHSIQKSISFHKQTINYNGIQVLGLWGYNTNNYFVLFVSTLSGIKIYSLVGNVLEESCVPLELSTSLVSNVLYIENENVVAIVIPDKIIALVIQFDKFGCILGFVSGSLLINDKIISLLKNHYYHVYIQITLYCLLERLQLFQYFKLLPMEIIYQSAKLLILDWIIKYLACIAQIIVMNSTVHL
jgi:hypothetical protein